MDETLDVAHSEHISQVLRADNNFAILTYIYLDLSNYSRIEFDLRRRDILRSHPMLLLLLQSSSCRAQ